MVLDSFKHPSNVNLTVLAISTVRDIVNFVKGLDPATLFEIWIGTQATTEVLTAQDTLIFSNVAPEAAIKIADLAQDAGMLVMRPVA